MTKAKIDRSNDEGNKDFAKLLESDAIKVPQVGDTVTGTVISASKSEIRLDLDGVVTGIIRGQELYDSGEEYVKLKPGDLVEATVIDEENENGELELSLKYAGQEKAWKILKESFENKTPLKIKVNGANRGGLIATFGQISGFIPVSQLAPDNYPRVSGGDKGKILEKLKSLVGMDMEVKVVGLDEDQREEKIIFSEKDVWNEKQKDIISKYKVGSLIEGVITAVTDFGVFISFGENLEGLIHISELAWQRIDNPADLYKVGEKIKAEIISIDGAKIFLSSKKLIKDPWDNVSEKYKSGQKVRGKILKVNPFGLFVKLDDQIHGLAHISQLNLAPGQKINELYKDNEERDFTIVTIEPKEHRLGLVIFTEDGGGQTEKIKTVKKIKEPKAKKEEKKDAADKDKEAKEKKAKKTKKKE